MKNTFCFMAVLGVCLVSRGASHAQVVTPRMARTLSWLPPQSETLAVAQGPFTIPKGDPTNKEAWRDFVGDRANPHFALSNLQLSVVVPNLAGRTIESSLEARGNFRPPAGFGLMLYDGCGFLQLRPLTGETAKSLQAKLARGATRKVTIAGREVAVFEQKGEHDLWRVYVAVPRPNVVLLTTTQAQLKTVLKRMNGQTAGPRAFPAGWNGWKLVNTSAPFWAIRRLDLKQSVGIFGPRRKDSQAIAFSVEATGASASALLLKYQSPNRNIAKRMFDALKNELRTGVTMRQTAPDVTLISVSNNNTGMTDFFVMGFLGTAVFV